MKKEMFKLFKENKISDDMDQGSEMYYAMYAYEQFGDATRDNSFNELILLGKELEKFKETSEK